MTGQSTKVFRDGHPLGVSKLPVRQVTHSLILLKLYLSLKLPVRQVTISFDISFIQHISKLPTRQSTQPPGRGAVEMFLSCLYGSLLQVGEHLPGHKFLSCLYGSLLRPSVRGTWLLFLSCLYGSLQ